MASMLYVFRDPSESYSMAMSRAPLVFIFVLNSASAIIVIECTRCQPQTCMTIYWLYKVFWYQECCAGSSYILAI